MGYSNKRKLTLAEVVEIIHRRSIPEPNSGCLLWEGGVQGIPENRHPAFGRVQPYGNIRLRGKMVAVHRVMFESEHGPIPSGMQVLHRCDVRLCCNPAHLFLGTNDQNHADKAAKDRGKKHLTHELAITIHAMKAAGHSQPAIAKSLHVNQSTISRILSGKRRSAALLAIR